MKIKPIKKPLLMPVLLGIAAALLFPAAAPASPESDTFRRAARTGVITAPVLAEISGMWASRTTPRVLWMVNDSGNKPVLYAVGREGGLLGEYRVDGLKNIDWEDLTGYRHGGQNFLVIADVGDNRSQRKDCALYFIKEPPVTGQEKGLRLQYSWQMRFRYKDGPRDCESVAVDKTNQKILLLSKREKHPVLYQLPLVLPPEKDLYTAEPVARVTTIPQPTPQDLDYKYGKYGSRPTSMEISPDGTRLMILTYKHIYLYSRKKGQTWQEAFNAPPETLPLPLPETGELVQREAMCMDPATGELMVTTEQLPAPIYTLAPAE